MYIINGVNSIIEILIKLVMMEWIDLWIASNPLKILNYYNFNMGIDILIITFKFFEKIKIIFLQNKKLIFKNFYN